MPQTSQYKPDDDDALWESGREEEVTDGDEVRDTRNGQQDDEGRFTPVAELA